MWGELLKYRVTTKKNPANKYVPALPGSPNNSQEPPVWLLPLCRQIAPRMVAAEIPTNIICETDANSKFRNPHYSPGTGGAGSLRRLPRVSWHKSGNMDTLLARLPLCGGCDSAGEDTWEAVTKEEPPSGLKWAEKWQSFMNEATNGNKTAVKIHQCLT